MRKIIYIIPGYGSNYRKNDKNYQKLDNLFKSKGFETIHVKIKWNRKSPVNFNDFVKDFLKVHKKSKNVKVYVFGFSFGATIAFLSASKTKPDGLILCSLSPYFKEDLTKNRKAWTKWWNKTFANSDFSFNKLSTNVKSKTYIFVGDKEGPECMFRAKEARKKIKHSKLVVIKGAEHDLRKKIYQDALIHHLR